jgi:hypothetical protein
MSPRRSSSLTMRKHVDQHLRTIVNTSCQHGCHVSFRHACVPVALRKRAVAPVSVRLRTALCIAIATRQSALPLSQQFLSSEVHRNETVYGSASKYLIARVLFAACHLCCGIGFVKPERAPCENPAHPRRPRCGLGVFPLCPGEKARERERGRDREKERERETACRTPERAP